MTEPVVVAFTATLDGSDIIASADKIEKAVEKVDAKVTHLQKMLDGLAATELLVKVNTTQFTAIENSLLGVTALIDKLNKNEVVVKVDSRSFSGLTDSITALGNQIKTLGDGFGKTMAEGAKQGTSVVTEEQKRLTDTLRTENAIRQIEANKNAKISIDIARATAKEVARVQKESTSSSNTSTPFNLDSAKALIEVKQYFTQLKAATLTGNTELQNNLTSLSVQSQTRVKDANKLELELHRQTLILEYTDQQAHTRRMIEQYQLQAQGRVASAKEKSKEVSTIAIVGSIDTSEALAKYKSYLTARNAADKHGNDELAISYQASANVIRNSQLSAIQAVTAAVNAEITTLHSLRDAQIASNAIHSTNSQSAINQINREIELLERRNVAAQRQVSGFNIATQRADSNQQLSRDLPATHSQTSVISELTNGLNKLQQTLMLVGVAMSGRQIMEYADQWTHFTNAVSIATEKTGHAAQMQSTLFAVAQNTRAPLETITSLYLRMARAGETLNMSQAQTVSMISTVNKALAIMGTSPAAVRGGLLQLEQALGGVTVRGQEFKSILDSMPNIIAIVAKNYDEAARTIEYNTAVLQGATAVELEAIASKKGHIKTIADLRNQMYAGKVSSEAFAQAILLGQNEIDATFARTHKTFSQAFTVFDNGMTKTIGQFNEGSHSSDLFFGAMEVGAKNIDVVAAALIGLAAAYTGVKIAAALTASAEMAEATVRTGLTLAKNPIAVAAVAATAVGAAASTYYALTPSKESLDRDKLAHNELQLKEALQNKDVDRINQYTKLKEESIINLAKLEREAGDKQIHELQEGIKKYDAALKNTSNGVITDATKDAAKKHLPDYTTSRIDAERLLEGAIKARANTEQSEIAKLEELKLEAVKSSQERLQTEGILANDKAISKQAERQKELELPPSARKELAAYNKLLDDAILNLGKFNKSQKDLYESLSLEDARLRFEKDFPLTMKPRQENAKKTVADEEFANTAKQSETDKKRWEERKANDLKIFDDMISTIEEKRNKITELLKPLKIDVDIKGNNLGNIRPTSGSGFNTYGSAQEGLSAVDRQLAIYGSKHSIDTLEKTISRWSPPNENDTARLIRDALKDTGLKPNQKIDLSDAAVRKLMTHAIISQEHGKAVADNAMGGISESTIPMLEKRTELDAKINSLYSARAAYEKEANQANYDRVQDSQRDVVLAEKKIVNEKQLNTVTQSGLHERMKEAMAIDKLREKYTGVGENINQRSLFDDSLRAMTLNKGATSALADLQRALDAKIAEGNTIAPKTADAKKALDLQELKAITDTEEGRLEHKNKLVELQQEYNLLLKSENRISKEINDTIRVTEQVKNKQQEAITKASDYVTNTMGYKSPSRTGQLFAAQQDIRKQRDDVGIIPDKDKMDKFNSDMDIQLKDRTLKVNIEFDKANMQTAMTEMTAASKTLADSFGSVGKSIGDMGTSLMAMLDVIIQTSNASKVEEESYTAQRELVLAKKDNSVELAELDKSHAAEKSKLDKKSAMETIDGMANIAGAASQMFAKQSAGRKALHAVEMTLHIAGLAMKIVDIATNIPLTISNMAAGAAKFFAQSGWAGFAGVAAMAAVMAGLGFAMMGGGGSKAQDTSTPDTATTGSVKGDNTIASNSVNNVVDTLNSIHAREYVQLVAISDGFRNLKSAVNNTIEMAVIKNTFTGNVNAGSNKSNSGALEKQFAIGLGTTVISAGLASIGIGTGLATTALASLIGVMSGISTSITGALVGVSAALMSGGLMAAAAMGGIGILIGAAIYGLGKLLGVGKVKYETLGYGMVMNAHTMILDGAMYAVTVFDYTKVKQTIKGWFSDSVKIYDVINGINPILSGAVTRVFGSFSSIISSAVATMDLGNIAAKEVFTPKIKLNFKGLKPEDVTKKINDSLNATMDTMTEAIFKGYLTPFKKMGEGALESLGRIAAETGVVQNKFNKLGLDIGNTGLGLITVSQSLMDVFESSSNAKDGLKNFISVMDGIYESWTSKGKKSEDAAVTFENLAKGINTSSTTRANLPSEKSPAVNSTIIDTRELNNNGGYVNQIDTTIAPYKEVLKELTATLSQVGLTNVGQLSFSQIPEKLIGKYDELANTQEPNKNTDFYKKLMGVFLDNEWVSQSKKEVLGVNLIKMPSVEALNLNMDVNTITIKQLIEALTSTSKNLAELGNINTGLINIKAGAIGVQDTSNLENISKGQKWFTTLENTFKDKQGGVSAMASTNFTQKEITNMENAAEKNVTASDKFYAEQLKIIKANDTAIEQSKSIPNMTETAFRTYVTKQMGNVQTGGVDATGKPIVDKARFVFDELSVPKQTMLLEQIKLILSQPTKTGSFEAMNTLLTMYQSNIDVSTSLVQSITDLKDSSLAILAFQKDNAATAERILAATTTAAETKVRADAASLVGLNNVTDISSGIESISIDLLAEAEAWVSALGDTTKAQYGITDTTKLTQMAFVAYGNTITKAKTSVEDFAKALTDFKKTAANWAVDRQITQEGSTKSQLDTAIGKFSYQAAKLVDDTYSTKGIIDPTAKTNVDTYIKRATAADIGKTDFEVKTSLLSTITGAADQAITAIKNFYGSSKQGADLIQDIMDSVALIPSMDDPSIGVQEKMRLLLEGIKSNTNTIPVLTNLVSKTIPADVASEGDLKSKTNLAIAIAAAYTADAARLTLETATKKENDLKKQNPTFEGTFLEWGAEVRRVSEMQASFISKLDMTNWYARNPKDDPNNIRPYFTPPIVTTATLAKSDALLAATTAIFNATEAAKKAFPDLSDIDANRAVALEAGKLKAIQDAADAELKRIKDAADKKIADDDVVASGKLLNATNSLNSNLSALSNTAASQLAALLAGNVIGTGMAITAEQMTELTKKVTGIVITPITNNTSTSYNAGDVNTSTYNGVTIDFSSIITPLSDKVRDSNGYLSAIQNNTGATNTALGALNTLLENIKLTGGTGGGTTAGGGGVTTPPVVTPPVVTEEEKAMKLSQDKLKAALAAASSTDVLSVFKNTAKGVADPKAMWGGAAFETTTPSAFAGDSFGYLNSEFLNKTTTNLAKGLVDAEMLSTKNQIASMGKELAIALAAQSKANIDLNAAQTSPSKGTAAATSAIKKARAARELSDSALANIDAEIEKYTTSRTEAIATRDALNQDTIDLYAKNKDLSEYKEGQNKLAPNDAGIANFTAQIAKLQTSKIAEITTNQIKLTAENLAISALATVNVKAAAAVADKIFKDQRVSDIKATITSLGAQNQVLQAKQIETNAAYNIQKEAFETEKVKFEAMYSSQYAKVTDAELKLKAQMIDSFTKQDLLTEKINTLNGLVAIKQTVSNRLDLVGVSTDVANTAMVDASLSQTKTGATKDIATSDYSIKLAELNIDIKSLTDALALQTKYTIAVQKAQSEVNIAEKADNLKSTTTTQRTLATKTAVFDKAVTTSDSQNELVSSINDYVTESKTTVAESAAAMKVAILADSKALQEVAAINATLSSNKVLSNSLTASLTTATNDANSAAKAALTAQTSVDKVSADIIVSQASSRGNSEVMMSSMVDVLTLSLDSLKTYAGTYSNKSSYEIGRASQDQLQSLLRTAAPYRFFADGGAFTNGVVSKPTSFNMGLMGESGSEAIMPLTNVNGKLGVHVVQSANDSNMNSDEELAELKRQNQILQAQNAILQEGFKQLIAVNRVQNDNLEDINSTTRKQVNN